MCRSVKCSATSREGALRLNKFFFIGLSVAISAFIAANALLMFGEKSILVKDVYISEYQRAFGSEYQENMPKEAITAPLGTTQIYVQDSEAIEQWLVKEGDPVQAGSELALLNEAETEEQRSIWESERSALESEKSEVQSSLRDLESARSSNDGSASESNADRSTGTNGDGDTIEFNVDLQVGVEVPQDGSYAAGIAQAEQRLAAIESQLAVVNAQLDQRLSNPALISPVDGVVAKVNGDSLPLSIEIYSNDKSFITYAFEDEWQDIAVQDRVMVQAEGMAQAVAGTVLAVSPVPAEDSRWLDAYRALEPTEQPNPLAFYEVRIMPDQPIEDNLPFGHKANAQITVNEAQDAVALPEPWLFDRNEQAGFVHKLSPEGYAIKVPATVSFDTGGKAVLTEGVIPGEVAVEEDRLRRIEASPAVFVPFPIVRPDFELAKDTNWRVYVEYLLAR